MTDDLPPLSVADFSLPFLSRRFNDGDFEELCADLFQQELGLRFFNYGRKGDSQHGIDLISETPQDTHHGVQCKRVKEFKPFDLRTEIGKLQSLPLRLSHLYFAVACDVSSEVRNECAAQQNVARTSKGPIPRIELWDRSFLSRSINRGDGCTLLPVAYRPRPNPATSQNTLMAPLAVVSLSSSSR